MQLIGKITAIHPPKITDSILKGTFIVYDTI